MINVKLHWKNTLSTISVLLLFASCVKEEPNQVPEIKLYSPAKHQVFNVLDTIWVSGKIRDDNSLIAIKVVLTDLEFKPVHKAVYIYPSGNAIMLDFGYPLDNQNLKGGLHYLQIRAEDGFNFRNFYQEITLVEIPREMLQVIVLTKPQSNSIQLTGINSEDEVFNIASISGDYAGSAISSKNQQLYVSGRNSLNLLAYDLQQQTIAWQKPVVQPFPMHLENCLYFDNILLASFNYDFILGFNEQGSVVFNASTEDSDAPARIGRTGNFVVADIRKKNIEPPFIKTMYYTTGIEKQRIQTYFEVVEFHPIANNKLIITANTDQTGLILTYDIDQNLLLSEKQLPYKINCSAAFDENNILIGSSEALLQYKADQNLFFVLLADQGADRLVYESLTSRLYIARDNNVYVYQYPQMQHQKTFPFSDVVFNLHVQYSKE